MAHEYQVWGKPPGEEEVMPLAAFEPKRWQWAEKLAAYLEERDYTEVTVELVEAEEECN